MGGEEKHVGGGIVKDMIFLLFSAIVLHHFLSCSSALNRFMHMVTLVK